MALHSTVSKIIESSESLATELGLSFSSQSIRDTGTLLSFVKRPSGKEKSSFKFKLLFPFRSVTEHPSMTSLRLYKNYREIDSGIDTDPHRITSFADVEYIVRHINDRIMTPAARPVEIPVGYMKLSYDELVKNLGSYVHMVESDSSGMVMSLYGNNDESIAVRLHLYELPAEDTAGIGPLSLISAEHSYFNNGLPGASHSIPVTAIYTVPELVNMVDMNLKPANKKPRSRN